MTATEIETIGRLRTIVLSNDKTVGNFSSPHSFRFTDGSELPAVSDELAEKLKVTFHEIVHLNGDTELTFTLSSDVMEEVRMWESLYVIGDIDVVFCPLPMITALKDRHYHLIDSPFRGIRIDDRVKKLVSINKQCI